MMYKMTQLSNGLPLVTVPMTGMNSVSVGVWVRAGSRYEMDAIAGVSHFIEHLVFKRTKNRNVKKIKETIEGRGGMLNAFTSEEATCYYVKILKKHLAIALDLLMDLVHEPVFHPEDIEMERTVILEEIKMYKDLPQHLVQEVLTELMWPKHPLGRPILGTVDTISKMTRKQIVSYKESFYQNARFVVVVSGDIQHDEIAMMLSGYSKRKKRMQDNFRPFINRQKQPALRFIEKETEQTHFVLGYHCCSRLDEKRYALSLLHILLGGNMSSRLFDQVREKRGLAYDIRSQISLFQDTGAFFVSAGVENGKALKALDIIFRELNRITRTPVSQAELRRAKDYYLGQLFLMFESTMDNMLWYGERLMYIQKVNSVEEIGKRIESITSKDIMSLAREVFCRNSLNLALVGKLNQSEQIRIRELSSLK